MTTDTTQHRLALIALCALTLFGALFARLWILQIVQADALDEIVSDSTKRTIILPAARGNIYDVNGLPLVKNRESIVVSLDRQKIADLKDKEEDKELAEFVEAVNRFVVPNEAITVADVRRKLNDTRYSAFRPAPILEDVRSDLEIYLQEQADRYPAVVVERQTVRTYPYGSLAAHILGRVGAITPELLAANADYTAKPYSQNDEIGLAGVEASYEKYLRGTPGKQVIEVDRRNRKVREISSESKKPIPGDDVYLSIDLRIQYKAEEALRAWIINSKTKYPRGAVVVEDPRNAQILAMASYPTFQPSDLVGGISTPQWTELMEGDTKAGLNRAISEGYPAASTFKIATAFAGLKLGIITPDEMYNDTGIYELCDKGRKYGCIKQNSGRTRHGMINLTDSIRVSSDTYYYRIGAESWIRYKQQDAWGEDALQAEMAKLGYGAKTAIDLPGETKGVLPTPETNRKLQDALWEQGAFNGNERQWQQDRLWQTGDSANISTGQGDVLASPLQTANAYSALANDQSILYEPSIVSKVTAAGDVNTIHYALRQEDRVIRTVDFGAAKQSLLDGFHGAVNQKGGTAYNVFKGFPLDTYQLSGKTGTAEVGFGKKDKEDNSMFVAFTPPGTGQAQPVVVSVVIEAGGFGAHAAAPAARMILEPIADGSLYSFSVPLGAGVSQYAADAAAARTKNWEATGTD